MVSDRVAAMLLTNAEFVDADTGRNLNYCCADCGVETLSEAFISPRCDVIQYRDGQGRRLCVEHFIEQHPEWREWNDILARRGNQEPVEPPEPRSIFSDSQ